MGDLVKNVEVFLRYGPIGILALYMIITYLKDRQYMKIIVDHIAVMNELKILIQELVWKNDKDD